MSKGILRSKFKQYGRLEALVYHTADLVTTEKLFTVTSGTKISTNRELHCLVFSSQIFYMLFCKAVGYSWLIWSCQQVKILGKGKRIRRGGGGEHSTKSYMARLRPKVQVLTLSFLYHFWKKRYPFRIPFFDKWYPFHTPSSELCIPFKCRNFTVFLNINK